MENRNDKTKQNDTKRIRFWYILFSIVASLALWLYVTYVDNPESSTSISGIPIEFDGEDILLDNNLMVTSVSTNKLNIRFSGRFNTLSKLSDSKISAVVDLSEIVSGYSSNPGTYMLSYDLNYDGSVSLSDLQIENANYNYVAVTVEKIVSVSIPVTGTYDGKIAEGYTAEPLEYSADYITVRGPQAVVSQISYAWVTLNRDNLSKTVSEEVPVVLMDDDGKEIESDSLILSQDTVTVTLKILMVKEVPLTVNLAGGASANDNNTRYDVNPKSVTISGEPEILAGINQIVLGTIDLTKFATTTSESFQIPIPNDVNNLTGETTAEVKVEVIGLSTRRLSATNIQYKNLTDGYAANIITQSLDVLIRGVESVINRVEPENIRIVADLTELGNTTGTSSVPAKVYIDGDDFGNVDAIGDYKVTVAISELTS